uniref:ATP synthase F0 subunit 8 n=1 Tax=Mutela dubia TaxID=152234 RepID=A0A1X9JRU7_9BIVA|nr:ATP synthase F0 subunit 8 [Mutela dubia]AQT38522.1 ATP synthase F0 subunit 8 [Mutela dubia]
MPQLSPMSWVITIFSFFVFFSIFVVSIWWGKVSCYSFLSSDKVGVSGFGLGFGFWDVGRVYSK